MASFAIPGTPAPFTMVSYFDIISAPLPIKISPPKKFSIRGKSEIITPARVSAKNLLFSDIGRLRYISLSDLL